MVLELLSILVVGRNTIFMCSSKFFYLRATPFHPWFQICIWLNDKDGILKPRQHFPRRPGVDPVIRVCWEFSCTAPPCPQHTILYTLFFILYDGNGPQRANTAFQRNSEHNMDQLPCVLGAMPLKKMRPVHLCLIAIFFKWPLATKGTWKSCLLVRADDQHCLMFFTQLHCLQTFSSSRPVGSRWWKRKPSSSLVFLKIQHQCRSQDHFMIFDGAKLYPITIIQCTPQKKTMIDHKIWQMANYFVDFVAFADLVGIFYSTSAEALKFGVL